MPRHALPSLLALLFLSLSLPRTARAQDAGEDFLAGLEIGRTTVEDLLEAELETPVVVGSDWYGAGPAGDVRRIDLDRPDVLLLPCHPRGACRPRATPYAPDPSGPAGRPARIQILRFELEPGPAWHPSDPPRREAYLAFRLAPIEQAVLLYYVVPATDVDAAAWAGPPAGAERIEYLYRRPGGPDRPYVAHRDPLAGVTWVVDGASGRLVARTVWR